MPAQKSDVPRPSSQTSFEVARPRRNRRTLLPCYGHHEHEHGDGGGKVVKPSHVSQKMRTGDGMVNETVKAACDVRALRAMEMERGYRRRRWGPRRRGSAGLSVPCLDGTKGGWTSLPWLPRLSEMSLGVEEKAAVADVEVLCRSGRWVQIARPSSVPRPNRSCLPRSLCLFD